MAKGKRPDQHTETCDVCGGEGVVPGDRYTEAAKVCPTCAGAGVVPVRDKSGA